jgi:hypothetical protein
MAVQLRLRFTDLPKHDLSPAVPMSGTEEIDDPLVVNTAPDSPAPLAMYLKRKIRQSRSYDDVRKAALSPPLSPLQRGGAFFGSQSNLSSSPQEQPEFAQSSFTGAAVGTVDRGNDWHSFMQLPLLKKRTHKRDGSTSSTSSVQHVYPSMLEKWLSDVYICFMEIHNHMSQNSPEPVEWIGNLCVPSLAQYDPSVLCPTDEGLYGT